MPFPEYPLPLNAMNTPTLSQLQRGLAIFEQIAALETELAAIFNGSAPAPAAKATPAQSGGRTGKRSAATIAKMKASQQARWAKIKGTKVPAAAKAPAPVKKKGGMSAEGRARIVAAQKARWAKIKGEAPATSKAPAKATVEAPAKKKRKPISAEHRAKLAAAAKARWAAVKKK